MLFSPISPALWPKGGQCSAQTTPDDDWAVQSCLEMCRAYPRLWFVDNHCWDERQEAPVLVVIGRDDPCDGERRPRQTKHDLACHPDAHSKNWPWPLESTELLQEPSYTYVRVTTNNTFSDAEEDTGGTSRYKACQGTGPHRLSAIASDSQVHRVVNQDANPA